MTLRGPVLVALALAGCDSGGRLWFAVDRVDALGPTWSWQAAAGAVYFRYHNPDRTQIYVVHMSTTYEIGGLEMTTEEGYVYDPSTEQRYQPFGVWLSRLPDVADGTLRGQDDITVAVSGQATFDTPWGRVEVPYDGAGVVRAVRVPTFTPRVLRVEGIEDGLADVTLVVDVDNDMRSSIAFADLKYAFDVANAPCGDGSFAVDLAGPGATELDLPGTLEVGDLPRLAWQAVQAGEGELQVELTARGDAELWSEEHLLQVGLQRGVPVEAAPVRLPSGI